MKSDFFENDRPVILGVPEIESMTPVIDAGYVTGIETTIGELCLWLDKVPSYYNSFSLDGVPRGTQAQLNILEGTVIETARSGDEESVKELFDLGKEFGLGKIRRFKLALDVKNVLKSDRAA